jgi:hypothetical protein
MLHKVTFRYPCKVGNSLAREVYLTFALWTSAVAIGLWGLALLFSLIGV